MSVFEALQNEHLLNGTTKEETTPEITPETPTTPVVETPEVPPVVVEETTPEEKEEVVETPKVEEPAELVPAVPEKVKVNYLDFLNEHKSTLDAYQAEKSADYSKMSPEQILKKSMQLKYPTLTSEDIDEELRLKYGLGVDTSDYDSEELIAHKAKQRKLKIDSADALTSLEAYRDSLTLPEFEIDVPTKEIVKTPEDLDDIIQKRIEADVQSNTTWREEVWVPEIKNTVNTISSLTEEVEIEGVGKFPVTVELSEEDKVAISDYLSGWSGHPSDSVYLAEGKEPDLKGFVQNKSFEILRAKMNVAIAKTAVEQYKSKFIKDEVVNFTQETVTTPPTNYEGEAVFDVIKKLRKR